MYCIPSMDAVCIVLTGRYPSETEGAADEIMISLIETIPTDHKSNPRLHEVYRLTLHSLSPQFRISSQGFRFLSYLYHKR